MLLYFVEGNPRQSVVPDVFVVLGAPKLPPRDNWLVWREGRVPDFVLEITSRTTRREDEGRKRQLYRRLGVTEYWQYDPTGDYLDPVLKGARLVDDSYRPIAGITETDGTTSSRECTRCGTAPGTRQSAALRSPARTRPAGLRGGDGPCETRPNGVPPPRSSAPSPNSSSAANTAQSAGRTPRSGAWRNSKRGCAPHGARDLHRNSVAATMRARLLAATRAGQSRRKRPAVIVRVALLRAHCTHPAQGSRYAH